MSEKLKVLELFSGIGACSKALERLGIDHEIVDSGEPTKFVTPEEYEIVKIKKGGKNGKRTELDTK